MSNFYVNLNNLPDVLKNRIYEMDSTYHKVFASHEFDIDLKQKYNKVVHIKKMIKSLIFINNDKSIQNENHEIIFTNNGKPYLSNEFVIFLEEEIQYTKFKILFTGIDLNMDYHGFDGFICTKEQHLNLFPNYCRYYQNHMHKVFEPFNFCADKINGSYMDFVLADNDAELYLHVRSDVNDPDFDISLIEHFTELNQLDPNFNGEDTYDDYLDRGLNRYVTEDQYNYDSDY